MMPYDIKMNERCRQAGHYEINILHAVILKKWLVNKKTSKRVFHYAWLGSEPVAQTFTDEEIERPEERYIECEISEIEGVLNSYELRN